MHPLFETVEVHNRNARSVRVPENWVTAAGQKGSAPSGTCANSFGLCRCTWTNTKFFRQSRPEFKFRPAFSTQAVNHSLSEWFFSTQIGIEILRMILGKKGATQE